MQVTFHLDMEIYIFKKNHHPFFITKSRYIVYKGGCVDIRNKFLGSLYIKGNTETVEAMGVIRKFCKLHHHTNKQDIYCSILIQKLLILIDSSTEYLALSGRTIYKSLKEADPKAIW